ncbi:hypothetical protein [Confluentibacter citreus]|uniref:hypothetical protein n=1 Tax=Confluentibacter citreus TaxID=2007307 RepID=UPI000C28F268|nr:hypothetical protein [Confluentibacter citreus]
MTAILILIVIIIGINLIPELTKKEFPQTEKLITRILIFTLVIFLIITILSFIGLKLKGLYTNSIIGLILIIASLCYFGIVKNTKRKIFRIILLMPFFLLSIYFHFFINVLGRYEINKDVNIIVSREGFLGCGEIIRLTKSKLLIFDKELIYDKPCLTGINKIETVEFDKNKAEFLIYHSGEMDTENPYHYEIENKNVW